MLSAPALALGNDGIVVSCEGVTKSYGSGQAKIVALRGVDLEVRRGEVLMIVGPSGCGKTTLISVMTAILNHDAGECRVLGRDLRSMDERARAEFRRKSIGFVFQMFNLLPALTAAENVAIPLLIEGVPWQMARSRADQLLGTVGLGARAAELPAKLSGGQLQRVAIARAMIHDPPLIVCDEPTSNLDHETGRAVVAMLRSLTETSHRTAIVVTHDPRIFEFADRIAQMDDGRITGIVKGSNRRQMQ